MRMLAVDTSERSCSVAVADSDQVLAELCAGAGGTHARHLMPMVRTALEMAGLAVADLDGFAATCGPGSFTGVRIGMSCVGGMAEAAGKPAVGVSSLQALARQCAVSDFLVCPMMDARRSEVYWALYAGDELAIVEAPRADAPAAALALVDRPCLFVGSGALAYRDLIVSHLGRLAVFVPAEQHALRAAAVARCGRQYLAAGNNVAPLVPVYLRASDAERNRACRPGSD